MIDLGDELAGYGKQPRTAPKPPEDMGSFGRLADLQAGGFNVESQRTEDLGRGWSFAGPGSFTVSAQPLTNPRWLARIAGGLTGRPRPPWVANPNQDGLAIEAKTWLPGDDDD